jgi:L-lactate permease
VWAFIVMAPILWLDRVALSGSNTLTNAMFGTFQMETQEIERDDPPPSSYQMWNYY